MKCGLLITLASASVVPADQAAAQAASSIAQRSASSASNDPPPINRKSDTGPLRYQRAAALPGTADRRIVDINRRKRERNRTAAIRYAPRLVLQPEASARSERISIQLARADPHHPLQVPDEDLAVADLAGAGGLHDRLDHRVDLLVCDPDFQLDLGQEVDHVFRAAIELGMALLAAEPLDLGGGDAGHAGLGQRLAHVIELERLDDGHDHLHRAVSCVDRNAGPA